MTHDQAADTEETRILDECTAVVDVPVATNRRPWAGIIDADFRPVFRGAAGRDFQLLSEDATPPPRSKSFSPGPSVLPLMLVKSFHAVSADVPALALLPAMLSM